MVAVLLGNESMVPNLKEARLAPERFCTLEGREISLVPPENRTPAFQIVVRRYTDGIKK
jgi:hypothetical protein